MNLVKQNSLLFPFNMDDTICPIREMCLITPMKCNFVLLDRWLLSVDKGLIEKCEPDWQNRKPRPESSRPIKMPHFLVSQKMFPSL